MIRLYHNNRCSKSRSAKQWLEDQKHDFEVVPYLDLPLSVSDLQVLLTKLGISAKDLVRDNELDFKEKYQGQTLSEEAYILAMSENPKLIQRPIVELETRAIIARPVDVLFDFFKS